MFILAAGGSKCFHGRNPREAKTFFSEKRIPRDVQSVALISDVQTPWTISAHNGSRCVRVRETTDFLRRRLFVDDLAGPSDPAQQDQTGKSSESYFHGTSPKAVPSETHFHTGRPFRRYSNPNWDASAQQHIRSQSSLPAVRHAPCFLS